MDYKDKSNNDLIKILNDLSDESVKLKSDVEKILLAIEDIEVRYNYIQELIKSRLKK